MNKGKVLLGMSGGVDSSVAAFILKNQGYEVQGFTLRMWSEDGRCCSRESIEAAVHVSRQIGIPHSIIDVRKQFEEEVVRYFIDEYKNGRTPNPCAVCNQRIRFGLFWESFERFGADFLSTGHYAKIMPQPNTQYSVGDPNPLHLVKSPILPGDPIPRPQENAFSENNLEHSPPPSEIREYFLAKAEDDRKSQEYFLALVPKSRLSKLLFPLGELTKIEVKKIAREQNLPCINRESQDICFIPDGDTQGFLKKHLGEKEGEIVDLEGNFLGLHKGIWFHTIGQRKGLGVAVGSPLFVARLDPATNRVIVGPRSALCGTCFGIVNINRFTDSDLSPLPLCCKIRYATPSVPCRLEGDRVILERELEAITPGQLAVIYHDDKVVMAGTISCP